MPGKDEDERSEVGGRRSGGRELGMGHGARDTVQGARKRELSAFRNPVGRAHGPECDRGAQGPGSMGHALIID
jgi:hypothetical protein